MNSPFTTHFLKMVRHVICRNDEGAFEYLKGWMAIKLQRPTEAMPMAIAMPNNQSAQTLAKMLCGIHRFAGHSSDRHRAVDLRADPSISVDGATFIVAHEDIVDRGCVPESIRSTGAAVLLLCNGPVDLNPGQVMILDHTDDVPDWLRADLSNVKKELGQAEQK